MYDEICERVSDQFFEFVRGYDNLDRLDDFEYLAEYLMLWVESGDAIEFCAGDFGTLMNGVAMIFAQYFKDPPLLDYNDGTQVHERRVKGFVDLELSSGLCMDRFWWDRQVFKARACCCPSSS